ncbi:CPBP family intramembrane glutamic endopeptidase [Algoriphagus alkaliphilus]|uniref:CPBP family intramembrane glutamic endopeptidase n=1 Tax=Algoriphagus alkaliphilus TaxID=279824 RepID=UPI001C31C412|nr:CPBP family intramembrane glutamic endopeptidase [Algoriphagus alkaliphilus]
MNRINFKTVGGLGFDLSHMIASFFYFFLSILLFNSLFFLNLKFDFLQYNFTNNFLRLFQDVLSNLHTAFFEEVFFRLFLFIGLLDIIKNRILLLILTSAIFSAVHFPPNTILIVSYFLGGLIYGYSYLKFQNFWVPVAIHFAWNFIQGSIFGFSVSGNSSSGLLELQFTESILWNGEPHGPEGSVAGLAMRLIILIALVIYPWKKSNPQFLNIKNLP